MGYVRVGGRGGYWGLCGVTDIQTPTTTVTVVFGWGTECDATWIVEGRELGRLNVRTVLRFIMEITLRSGKGGHCEDQIPEFRSGL